MAGQNKSPSPKRFHIVLVPGFGGFDALGQVEYYGGITPLFQTWKGRQPVVLHYFDNFPTAAVVTRAHRLEKFLAKRIARGEIAAGDEVTLVGHSTGGLDIRQVLYNWQDPGREPPVIDGEIRVEPERIVEHVRRVVFLSVPHWGTNIADWVRAHTALRKMVVTDLRGVVTGSQVPLLDWIEDQVAGGAALLTGSGLLRGAQDCLTEADESIDNGGPERIADAQEAASQLALYVRHMASDFRVIHDLTSQCPVSGPLSPAHFNTDQRARELNWWRHAGIDARSYVTLGRRPFHFATGHPAPRWELANPCTYPEIAKDSAMSKGTDIVYRVCYRACAGGPFQRPAGGGNVTRRLNGSPRHEIEVWDNDGIVNTASMPWPIGDNVLVAGDHLDIVGHYKAVKAAPGFGRTYQRYDSFKSESGFKDRAFEEVWHEIFEFCAGRAGSKARAAAA